MRMLAAYIMVFYGVLTLARVPSDVRRGRMASGGGLAQALAASTAVLAALGVLMGAHGAVMLAVASLASLSLLALYHAWLIDGHRSLKRQGARTVLAVVLVALLVFGD